MKKALILTGCLIVGNSLYARTIKGLVLSENDSTAVIGAVCHLSVNNLSRAQAATENSGHFVINDDTNKSGNLIISMTGYSNTEIIVPDGSKSIDLGTIYLSNNNRLKEVTVTAQQAIQTNQGRTIVIPSADDVRASSTSLTLFEKLPLPGLDADKINRKLSVDGGTPVILIDGVPSTIEQFNSLQAKDIERVEYSRITPARYADKGKSGFINIFLKQRNDGGSVYAWLRSCPTTCFSDAQINATYHQGPSQFSFSYIPSWRNYQSVYDNVTSSYIGDDFRVDLEQHDRNPFNYFTNRIEAKYTYHPNTSTVFAATFNLRTATSANRVIGTIIDSQLGSYNINNKKTEKGLTPSLDLFLHHDFNDKNSLEVEVVGTLSSSDYKRLNIYNYTDGNSDSYQNDVESHRRSLISEINYKHLFSDKSSFTVGVQNTVSHSKNEYLDTNYKPVLTENNNYVYARYGQQIGKVFLSLTSGMKLYWMKNDLNDRNFVRNISQVVANWNINNNWSIQGIAALSPSIPSLSSLTDYPSQQSQYLISNGNPNLHTSTNWVYRIMPTYNYKKFSATLMVTYRDIRDPFIDQDYYLGDKMFLSQCNNYDYQRLLANSLSFRISDIAGFGARANLYLERYWAAGEGWKQSLTSFNGNITLWWNKGPLTVSYSRNLPGKTLTGYYVSKDENNDMIDIEYKPDNHWTLTAGWWFMFDKKGTKYPSWSYSQVNPNSSERYIKDNGNMFVISASYSLDFGTLFNSGKRSLHNSDSGSALFKN